MKPTFYLLFIHLLLILSCKRDFSVSDNYEIQLTLESAEVVETWLKLKVIPLDTESAYTVKRDTQTVFSGKLIKADTLVHDINLQPNTNYIYKVYKSEAIVNSAKLEVTTMDTTSHDFTWQSFEFGDHSSSYFSDVAIAGEEIWAVGKVYTDSGDYNAAHWDGTNWTLIKIPVKIYNTNSFIISELKSIYAFDQNNIYVTTGGEVIHYDGTEWGDWTFLFNDLNDTTFGGVNKFWGISSTDFYGVGNKGNIFHYNGQTWQKLDSGTDVDINDIWGYSDKHTGENYILCPASYKYELGEKKIFSIQDNKTIIEENWPYPDRRIHSVWFKNNKKIFVCGAGVFERNRLGRWKEFTVLPLIYTNRIRGKDINDIFVSGDFGFLAHFNGLSWRIYEDAAVALFESIDYKNHIVCAVGERNSKAVILIMSKK